jgi:hypothetical protein
MARRLLGSLDGLIDSEQRPLRPIGTSVRDVATRTGRLLARLIDVPGVRLFACVRFSADLPPVAYAISAGRQLLLVESVAWPAGDYTTTPDGGVLCDGAYIGQSIGPLVGTARRLRRVLPRPHQVGAFVVVHPCDAGVPTLPASAPAELTWLPPGKVINHVGRTLSQPCARRRPDPVRDFLST